MIALILIAAIAAFVLGFVVGVVFIAWAIITARAIRRRRAREGSLRVVAGGQS